MELGEASRDSTGFRAMEEVLISSGGRNLMFPLLGPGDLPDPGIKPESLTFPALADRFFTTSAAWEAHSLIIQLQNVWLKK